MAYAVDDLAAAPARDAPWRFLAATGVFLGFALEPFLNAWGPLIALVAGALYCVGAGRTLLPAIAPVLPLMALPAWALLSTVWSDAPGDTFRGGLQYATTAFLALAMARTAPTRTLVASLLVACMAAVCVAFAVGWQDLARDRALSGGMGSKNYVALFASFALLAGLAVAGDAQRPPTTRWASLIGVGLGLAGLVLTRSAGGWLTAIAGFGALAALAISVRLKPMVRGAVLGALLLAGPLIAFGAPQIGAEIASAALKTAGRDPTLTRRTELWMRAAPIIAEKPVLGHGYRAFWRRGNVEAEGLWRAWHIRTRAWFGFHNQYVDLLVETGAAGLLLFAAMAIMGGVRLIAQAHRARDMSVAFFAAAFVALMARTPIEGMALSAFSVFSALFFMACALPATRSLSRSRTTRPHA